MTPQTWVAVIIGVLLTIMSFTTLVWAFSVMGLLMTLLIAAYSALFAYDTECLTTGGCTVWSWVRSALYAVNMLLWVATGIWVMSTGRSFSDWAPYFGQLPRELTG